MSAYRITVTRTWQEYKPGYGYQEGTIEKIAEVYTQIIEGDQLMFCRMIAALNTVASTPIPLAPWTADPEVSR